MHRMKTKTFKINACSNLPIGNDWNLQLVDLLGSKPRRLSRWCELGLFGALSCIRKAGQTHLPNDVAIRVYTEYGTMNATRMAMVQASEHLPMPFTFMQTQPGQLFNALGTALDWHGDGYTTSSDNRRHSEIALLRTIKHSSLLAWVDDEPELISRWTWLEEAEADFEPNWQTVGSIFQTSANARWLKIDSASVISQAS